MEAVIAASHDAGHPILETARVETCARDNRRARLLVVVVGETARAQQFGLNGYPRATTPELAAIDGLINFPNATSCGTDTAHSVPCMFSGLGRARFSNVAAETRENLLDILKRADFDVFWRDNQAGCKGVCKRVTTEDLVDHTSGDQGKIERHDEVLLDGLSERIATLSRDTVIVLHMMGSHGPAYWKRVPDAYRVFQPECEDTDLGRCSPEQLINAYDNTIRYTDHVLARLVVILGGAGEHNVDAAMMYASDHGESLGEYDLYLHGMPYALAPSVQTHVPMITWVSPSWTTRLKLDTACMTQTASLPVSHDNVFHSVLGVLDVATKVYDPSLDIYRACRRAHRAAKAQ